MAKPLKSKPEGMTGVAFSTQAFKDGNFTNFKICTLFIVDGEIVHVDKSQGFAGFEAIARTEIFINSSLWNLSSNYKDGKYQTLGGDHRDKIVNRLKKEDPELLKKIAPALGLKGGE